MRSISIDSPAKLNLALRILRKRKDGYHELVTLFHRISLRDTLRLRKRKNGIRLHCAHPRVPLKGNLIVSAFRLLKQRHPFEGGVTVHLTKRIPVGGGLGGGSSNAAAFLMGMKRLFRLRLTRNQWMKLGKELGADVPFFISGVAHALGRGRGDEIETLPFRRRLWFILWTCDRGLSTREVYSRFRLRERLTGASRDVKMASAFLEKGDAERASRFLKNDLTECAEQINSSLKKTRKSLSALHLGVCQMSGSGPTLFMIFTSPHQARRALHRFRSLRAGHKMILCRSD